MPAKPRIIIAHVEGSGTAGAWVSGPPSITSPCKGTPCQFTPIWPGATNKEVMPMTSDPPRDAQARLAQRVRNHIPVRKRHAVAVVKEHRAIPTVSARGRVLNAATKRAADLPECDLGVAYYVKRRLGEMRLLFELKRHGLPGTGVSKGLRFHDLFWVGNQYSSVRLSPIVSAVVALAALAELKSASAAKTLINTGRIYVHSLIDARHRSKAALH